jgi:hypothetical protein
VRLASGRHQIWSWILFLEVTPKSGKRIAIEAGWGGATGKKLIDIAQDAPKTVILAEDEASLYLQNTTMAVWAPKGRTPVVRSDLGRAKTNFYGTLNLHTGEDIVTQASEMNVEATASHLQQILETLPDVSILLLWDRAPWHRGPAIRDVLEANPRLEIIRGRSISY